MVDRKEVKLQIGTNVIQTGDGYDWELKSIKGDDYMDADVSIEDYASDDGGYVQQTRYEPRFIDMRIMSKAVSDEQINATQLLLHSYMCSKVDSIITVYKNGVERIGYGRIAKVKKVDGRMWWQRPYIVVTFVMPDPWYVGDEKANEFSSFTPLIGFPLSFIDGVGLTAGVVSAGNEITFDYNGHKNAGFVLTLTARGTVVNPKVTNQNGNYIKVLKTLTDNDIVVVSTVRGDPYVHYDGAFCKYDRLSTFFDLEVGSNTLTVSADSGVGLLAKSLRYRERFRG